ncbi:MAG: DASS family sodium-coupled anion symporter [Thermoanaerobaculia bacterium]|nr:DASS family sodium-coupled anion symporter [Thermoanaerobaculia bacterium]
MESSHPRERAWATRQQVGLVAGVAVFVVLWTLPAPTGMDEPAWATAAVGLLMAIWWMTEALPIAATSLLPLLLLPLLGVTPISGAAAPYANPLIFLFLGGFLIALAMERSGLHRRLALSIIRRVGTAPNRIVFGFMVAAAFLSMWISNTATAMMMLPIGISVSALVRRQSTEGLPDDDGGGTRNISLCLLLGIAYGCSLGGMATLVGTPTNALLVAFVAESFQKELSFASWMTVALPLSAVGIVVVFVVLTRFVYPIRIRSLPGGRALIDGELAKLGPLSRAERRVAWIFALTAGLWISRPLLQDVLPGRMGELASNLSDPGIAILGALLLFALPLDWKRGTFALAWGDTARLPWGVLLLFGGGLSLAQATKDTGLAEAIGGGLSGFSGWPPLLVTLAAVAMIILLTELTSNTATIAAFLPVLAALAQVLGREPLELLVPATLAASCAFMLPVATPPNAIIYGSGELTVPQMARAGVWLNVIFALLLTLLAGLTGGVAG